MRAALFFTLFLLFACLDKANAQFYISGTITGSNGKGISFASVVLHRMPDSSILQTAIADSNGAYSFGTGKTANTLIVATAAGYTTTARQITDTTLTRQNVDLVLEKESITLNEVAVSVRKPLIERKVDRTVFNVENSITAIGSDALEALRKAPGVRVSSNNDISIAGKSTVSIMINDKLVRVGGHELADMLRTIPSENIARIEVITTPPAKYDAAGNSGMINIVTKKQNKKGLNGTLGSNIIQNSLLSAIAVGTVNYRNNKLNIYALSNGGYAYSRPVERNNTYYSNQLWNQVSNIDNLRNFYYNQAGIDYNLTPKTILGIQYTYAGSTPKMNEDITGKWINRANGTDSILHTRARTNDFGERNVANINYEWKIDSTGKKLNLDADFFTRLGRTVRNFTTINTLGDGNPTGFNSIDRSTGKQVLYIGSMKADMELPGKFANISFGAKGSFIHVVSDNVFEYISNNAFVVDPGKTNKFDYQEYTEAIYISGQKEINKKWSTQAGLRAEYTQTRAASATLATANETKYLQLFPTAYLLYTLNEDHTFNLNYSRRIERPNMSLINPFRRYMTPNAYDEGNPFLKPSFSSNGELAYTMKSKYTFTLYAEHTQQVSTQILEVDSANKGFHFRYANIGTSVNYGFSASASLTPAKWWESNLQLYGFHSRVNANYYSAGTTNRYNMNGFEVENQNTFTLNKDKTLMTELSFEYSSATIENYDFHYPNANIYAGVRVLLFKKNLVVAATINDIFRTQIIRVRNLYNSTVTNNYYDARGARVNITWKFGNQNIKSKREHSNGLAEESKRS